jgi:hypothetical protein
LTNQDDLFVGFGLNDFLAAVETVRADVVTAMNFTGRRLNGQMRRGEEIMSAVHAAF